MGSEDILLYGLGFLVITNLILIIKVFSLSKKDNTDRLVKEIRYLISENNRTIMEDVLIKISQSERNQIKELLDMKNDITISFSEFQDKLSKEVNSNNNNLTEKLGINFEELNKKKKER